MPARKNSPGDTWCLSGRKDGFLSGRNVTIGVLAPSQSVTVSGNGRSLFSPPSTGVRTVLYMQWSQVPLSGPHTGAAASSWTSKRRRCRLLNGWPARKLSGLTQTLLPAPEGCIQLPCSGEAAGQPLMLGSAGTPLPQKKPPTRGQQ
jgi:hypothetical protein